MNIAINDNPNRPRFFRLLVMAYRRPDGHHFFCGVGLGPWRVHIHLRYQLLLWRKEHVGASGVK